MMSSTQLLGRFFDSLDTVFGAGGVSLPGGAGVKAPPLKNIASWAACVVVGVMSRKKKHDRTGRSVLGNWPRVTDELPQQWTP